MTDNIKNNLTEVGAMMWIGLN